MTEVTDEMLTDQAALVVEQLGDNYHEADLIGFAIHNENGAFLSRKKMRFNQTHLNNGYRMKRRRNGSLIQKEQLSPSDGMMSI